MKRRRYGRERWAAWIEQQQRSGLSIRQFCDRKGLAENSFYNWRRRLDEDERSPGAPAFLPVRLMDDQPARIEIELPCGAVIRVPDDLRVTRRVLRVLLQAGGRS